MRLCYYVSNHGWGHATWTVAVLRRFLRESGDSRVFVKAGSASPFLRSSMRDARVEVLECNNDFGYAIRPGDLGVDAEMTWELLQAWLKSWDCFVEREVAFCRTNRVDTIVSDIAPQPFLVANALGIRSYAVTNFTWHGLYQSLFGETTEVRQVARAYSLATLGIVLPFSEPSLPFAKTVPVGLVVRSTTARRKLIRSSLNVPRRAKLPYIGAGMLEGRDAVLEAADLRGKQAHETPFFILTSSNRSGYSCIGTRIPAQDTESQDYIAECDAIIIKPGYSTMSEAVQGEVSMLLVDRGLPEDGSSIEEAVSVGIASRVRLENLACGAWQSHVIATLTAVRASSAYHNIPACYTRDGCADICAIICQ